MKNINKYYINISSYLTNLAVEWKCPHIKCHIKSVLSHTYVYLILIQYFRILRNTIVLIKLQYD